MARVDVDRHSARVARLVDPGAGARESVVARRAGRLEASAGAVAVALARRCAPRGGSPRRRDVRVSIDVVLVSDVRARPIAQPIGLSNRVEHRRHYWGGDVGPRRRVDLGRASRSDDGRTTFAGRASDVSYRSESLADVVRCFGDRTYRSRNHRRDADVRRRPFRHRLARHRLGTRVPHRRRQRCARSVGDRSCAGCRLGAALRPG